MRVANRAGRVIFAVHSYLYSSKYSFHRSLTYGDYDAAPAENAGSDHLSDRNVCGTYHFRVG